MFLFHVKEQFCSLSGLTPPDSHVSCHPAGGAERANASRRLQRAYLQYLVSGPQSSVSGSSSLLINLVDHDGILRRHEHTMTPRVSSSVYLDFFPAPIVSPSSCFLWLFILLLFICFLVTSNVRETVCVLPAVCLFLPRC